MSTIKAQQIVDRAGVILQDTTSVRWPESELLDWLNDGQRETVLLDPSAHADNETVRLVSGSKQNFNDLASDPDNSGTNIGAGIRLIDVVRNMGTGGSTPGRSVTVIERKIIDYQVPDWHSGQTAAEAMHFMHDERDPKTFYVYPPQPGTGTNYVELLYSSSPQDVTLSDSISLDDVYANALLDYVLYRAYSKDADFGSAQLANAHYKAFSQSLGIKGNTDLFTIPGASMDTRERAQGGGGG